MENFNFQNVIGTIKNVQVYPATQRIELNDKATKIIFNLTPETYRQLVEQRVKANVTEKKNHKKYGRVKSGFIISNELGYSNFAPLTEFDRAVLSVCVSNWVIGNFYVTPAMIYRGLTGKSNKGFSERYMPHSNQYAAIIQSIDKLMFTSYDPIVLDAFEKLKYIESDETVEITKSAILPCYRIKISVNGQVTDAIFFDRESPLLTLANLKKQLITYDVELLDVPNQQNTPMIITLKNYIMRRVMEIKLHKQLSPTLTFEDIFKKCRIDGAKQKRNARDYIKIFLEHLVSKQVIKTFEFTKKGNAIHAVKFQPN